MAMGMVDQFSDQFPSQGVTDYPAQQDYTAQQAWPQEPVQDYGAYGGGVPTQQWPTQEGKAPDWLVQQIKDMQRTDANAKEQWWAYCDSQGGGIRDPAKHDSFFVQSFISQYSAGQRFEAPATAANADASVTLLTLIKEGQRKSRSWKEAWALYCDNYGGGIHDPARHDPTFLTSFMDFVGQQGCLALSGLLGQLNMGGYGNQAAGMMQPPNKRPREASTGDPQKDQLVQRIKAFQRTGDQNKELWHSFCDQQVAGVRDPARHEVFSLMTFVSAHGVP